MQQRLLVISLCEQPALSGLVDRFSFLFFARQQGGLAQIKQHVPAPSVFRTEQDESGAILGHGLLEGSGLQRLCGSTEGVMDSSLLVTAACEVEGQIGELGCAQGLLLPIARFQELPDDPMQASTPGGADFGIQALTDFVVVEEEASCLLGPYEPSTHRLEKAF